MAAPRPRLTDIYISPKQACEWHAFMVSQVVLMGSAGVITALT